MAMYIEVKSGREWVSRAMRATMGKRGSSNLSDESFRTMLKAGHSPVEEWEVWIDAHVPERVHTHIVRHEEIGKYVATSRPDIEGSIEQDGHRFLSLRINGKRLVEIMRQRLCNKSWWETRMFFREVAQKVILKEPAFDGLLAPTCVWYGFCPEHCSARPTCGFMETDMYRLEREKLTGKESE